MYVRTLPREIAARWIKPGDEVAMYEVEDGSGEADSGLRDFCRTAEFVERFCSADWWLVVDGPDLVKPPADDTIGRVPGDVKHGAGGWWRVEPADRGFVPDDLDHVGAVSFVMAGIVDNRIGHPRVYFAGPDEQFVIRERVKVDATEYAEHTIAQLESTMRAGALRLVSSNEPTEGQRAGAVSTVAEPRDAEQIRDVPAEERTAEELYRYGTDGPWPGKPLPVIEVRHDEEERGSADRVPGEETARLPMRRIPLGVLGASMGGTSSGRQSDAGSGAWQFQSERESDAS